MSEYVRRVDPARAALEEHERQLESLVKDMGRLPTANLAGIMDKLREVAAAIESLTELLADRGPLFDELALAMAAHRDAFKADADRARAYAAWAADNLELLETMTASMARHPQLGQYFEGPKSDQLTSEIGRAEFNLRTDRVAARLQLDRVRIIIDEIGRLISRAASAPAAAADLKLLRRLKAQHAPINKLVELLPPEIRDKVWRV